jgi:hypothetical protein
MTCFPFTLCDGRNCVPSHHPEFPRPHLEEKEKGIESKNSLQTFCKKDVLYLLGCGNMN